jgi:hypothetical protein
MKKVRIAASALALIAAASAANAQVLKFDDIVGATTSGSGITIGNYYNGGGGPAVNFGVDFVGNAIAFCLNRPSNPSCSNTSWGSGADAVAADARGTRGAGMTWLSANPIMNRVSGFTTGFSFFYSNPFSQNVGFTVWSGLNGTGTLLATWTSSPTQNGSGIPGCFSANYCPFVAGGIGFAGTAQSVVFNGAANQFVYDDFTFGSVDPGVNPSVVPEPSTYALMATGLIGLAGLRRRNKNR